MITVHIPHSACHGVCYEGEISCFYSNISFFKLKFMKMEDNCVTILCWFLPYINMN